MNDATDLRKPRETLSRLRSGSTLMYQHPITLRGNDAHVVHIGHGLSPEAAEEMAASTRRKEIIALVVITSFIFSIIYFFRKEIEFIMESDVAAAGGMPV